MLNSLNYKSKPSQTEGIWAGTQLTPAGNLNTASVNELWQGFTLHIVNRCECKYRADTNDSFLYSVICSEKSQNVIWKLQTQLPTDKVSSRRLFCLVFSVKLQSNTLLITTEQLKPWHVLLQLNLQIIRSSSKVRWWWSISFFCAVFWQICARQMHVCVDMSVSATGTGWSSATTSPA